MNKKSKISANLASMMMTLLLCSAVPISHASDREIYTTATNGNTTIMLTLDQSLSMSIDTWDYSACDAPDGYLDIAESSAKDDFVNKYAANHVGSTFSYKRSYCTAKPPIIKSRSLYNASKQYVYQRCTNSTTTNPIYKYEDCVWGASSLTKPLNSGGFLYRLPGTSGFQVVYAWFDKAPNSVKLYDRMTRVKDGIYEVLYGPKPIDNSVTVGLALFPVSTSPDDYKGHIQIPARLLDTAVGSSNQRATLMTAVAAMRGVGVTPIANVYADVAAYLLGSNTLLRSLQKIAAVERIEWKICFDNLDNGRNADGGCRVWNLNTDDWYRVSLPSLQIDVNSLKQRPLSMCTNGVSNANILTGMTGCYVADRTMVRYVAAIPEGGADLENAVWRTCTRWNENGKCVGDSWDRDTGSTLDTWSRTKPNNDRLILDFEQEGLTTAQKAAAYNRISVSEFSCPDSGLINGGGAVDSSYKVVCFGEDLEVPVFAVKRILKDAVVDTLGGVIDPGSPQGVWKVCTGGYNTDGSCKAFTPPIPAIINGSINNSTTSALPNNYIYWSNIRPTGLDGLPSGFCSTADSDGNPGNGTGATGICYYQNDNTVFLRHGLTFYAGFEKSVSESKIMTNSDVLKQVYKRPDAVETQLNSTQQCGGQGIYILTDGEANGSDTTIARTLYRSALINNSKPDISRNFSCADAEFGIDNTMWGCVANFSRTLLNRSSNPIGLPIKTATVGFGADYADLPAYDKSLSVTQNAASIKDFFGSNERIKNMALLGVYGQGGWYKGSNAEDVADSIRAFLDTFAVDIPPLNTGTVTIPVDALNPIEIQPFAYYPEFKPTPDSSYPLWFGNVKKYNVVNGVLKDKNQKMLLNELGQLNENLTDLWGSTPSNSGAFSNIPFRSFNPESKTFNDGSRKLLINQREDTSVSPTQFVPTKNSLTRIDKSYIGSKDSNKGYLLALLGYSISPEQAKLSAEALTQALLEKTPEIKQMGGAIHSSPLLLTQYGRVTVNPNGMTTSDRRDEYIAFGTSQGLFQVVDYDTGKEVFAFVPHEMLRKQKDGFLDKGLQANSLQGVYHGVDGAWTAHTEYVPAGEKGTLTVGTGKNNAKGKQWVYGGLRMGGQSYYALDLSNMNDPKLKFHIDPENASSTDPIRFMGQSWSQPTLTFVNWKGKRKLVMFVGGGYDEGYESDTYEQINGKGAGVYMFDADNGDLLWWSSSNASTNNSDGAVKALKNADMKYSVVSRIKTLDRNVDGLADHLYFADLGGQVWRVDIDNSLKIANSQFAKRAVRLLNLHSTANDGSSPRFYEAPNVGIYNEPGVGRYAVVATGSGNRSQPLKQYSTSTVGNRANDAVFVVYDKDVAKSTLYELADNELVSQNFTRASLVQNLDRTTGTPIAFSNNGWYYNFVSRFTQSAKVMGELVSINKNLYVPVFDASKDGTAGSCGTGVKGVSSIQRLCLPFGKCAALRVGQSNDLVLGSGILGINVGPGETKTSLRIAGGPNQTKGGGGDCDGNGNCVLEDHPRGRILTPDRWYEALAKQ